MLSLTHTKKQRKSQDFRLKFSISDEKSMELCFSPEMAMQIVSSMDTLNDHSPEQNGFTSIKFGGKEWAIVICLDKELANDIRDDMEASALNGMVLPPQLQITEYSSGKSKLKKWLAMIRVFCGGAIT
ncbi:hypothetical protein [Acidithiobacillus ferriphilus]|uniref:hypothetical protein n=1 Tax=Acidithiobacillus ferriphilus TaxID=1689834 RepID=UPI002DBFCEEF|nr:hypothetical protein [Acidithiobacillus ferriphilus]MEB8476706.1 hypothetical protein [Acidithiobacillus ferriphilus]